MSYPLNRYQRRVANKRAERLSVISFCLTSLLFIVAYLVFRNALMNSMYDEVFASNFALTLEQVQARRFNAYIFPVMTAFMVVWVVLLLVLTFYFRRRPTTFNFDDEPSRVMRMKTSHSTDLYSTTPGGFEQRVAWLITQQTGYRTQVTGGSGDKGADIKVFDANHQLVGVVQCKRYRPNTALPPAYIQQMVGVRQTFNVNIVYLATTAYFTEDTKRLAKQLNVRLIDGYDLRHISSKVALPIQQTPSGKYAFDTDPHARFRPSQQSKTNDNYSFNDIWDE